MYIGYIDPGTGSMLISALIAGLSVVFFALKDKIYTLFSKKGDKGDYLNLNKEYNVVFYSEGKQYWNVFKPLIEEGTKCSISMLYLTSDKEDPGLNFSSKVVTPIYIGTGKEAYYKLNRLKANIVILTTPGLDVLEIKKSKDVKHYMHISHSTGSFAGYKSYGTDYYDSVLVGGEGNKKEVRELEKKRNLCNKEIEIIGNTYLDILRRNLKNKDYKIKLFKNKKPVILISPTWGNHGLLNKYGDELLAQLDKTNKYNVIVRPHPQSFVSDIELMDYLMSKYPDNGSRLWDTERENLIAMNNADVMISDFSGIIYDFYSLFTKPILTFHSIYEKRGRDAMDLKEDPWDIKILDKIGRTVNHNDIVNILEIVDEVIKKYNNKKTEVPELMNLMDKYPNESGLRGMKFVKNQLKKLIKEQNHDQVREKSNLLNEDFSLKNKSLKSFLTSLIRAELLFQVLMAGILFLAFIYLGLKLLPSPGLNVEYLTRLNPYVLYAVACVFIIFLFSIWIFNAGEFNYLKKKEKFERLDLFLISLPLTPVIQYIISNQDILTFKDSFYLLNIFLFLSIFFIALVPVIISPILSKTFSVPAISSCLFIILNMASFGRTTTMKSITLILLMIFLSMLVLKYFDKTKILISFSLIFLIVNTSTELLSLKKEDMVIIDHGKYKLLTTLNKKETKHMPNIYLMIYDAYPNEETLNYYKFDNSKQIEYLIDKGFAIYDGTYSIGNATLISMSQVLHVSVLRNMNEYRKHLAGEANGLKIFRKLGYDTYFLTRGDYMTKGYERNYTMVYPPTGVSIKSHKIILRAILEGEFRFDVEFSDDSNEGFLKAKSELLRTETENHKFFYQHSNYPGHSQNSGILLPNERELFFERMDIANKEMIKDLNDLNLNTSTDIVIIAGDHGPYLTKNGIGLGDDYEISDVTRLDIQDRYGTFLAIYWPDEKYINKFKIKTIQDILPAIFSYMYDDDTIFDKVKMSNEIETSWFISGVSIKNDLIIGGKDDGKNLFKNYGVRTKTNNYITQKIR